MKAGTLVCRCGHSRRWHRGDRGHCSRTRCGCVVLRPRPEKARTTTDAESAWAVERIQRAILATMAKDPDAAGEAVTDLALRGEATLFGAACAFAATIKDPADDRIKDWSLEVEDARTGALLTEDAGDPRARQALWLGRFLTAAANDDADTQLALWGALEGDLELLIERTCDLLKIAASAVSMHGGQERTT